MSRREDLIGAGWPLHFGLKSHGVTMVIGESKIIESIAIILNTPPGARPMRPTFGCNIHELAFAPLNAATAALARQHVAEALAMWEPRIEVLDVQAEPIFEGDPEGGTDRPCLYVLISYRIRATHDERALVYPFYTIPEEF